METQDILELLTTISSLSSTSDNSSALQAVADVAADFFAIPELKVERFTSNDKVNLLVSPANHKGRTFDIILNGHLDVVPAKASQFALQVKDGKAIGRGVYDMKGGAVVLMQVYKDLAQSGQLGSVALTLVTDEEIGGHNGAKLLLEKEGITGKFFLVGEPTDFAICHQQKGILWLELVEHGKPAHGSRPWEGKNANISLARKITTFYDKYPQPTGKDDWKTSYTLSIVRGGGDAKNVVADKATAYMDIRRVESESANNILQKIRGVFGDTEVHVLLDEPCLAADQADKYIQQLAEAIKKETGKQARFTRETFGSDARFYSAVGIPAVNFGPIGGDMHGDNEWVDISSLQTYYDIMKRFLLASEQA